jgi:hypothetical protein
MRYRLLLIIASIAFVQNIFGQMIDGTNSYYGNEWINYNQTYYKIKIVSDGIYKISQSTLMSAGIDINTSTGDKMQIYRYGKQVPIYVSNNGVLGANDFIEFFAKKNDGFLDKFMYENNANQPSPQYSNINDTAVYFLTIGNASQSLRIQDQAYTIPAGASPEEYIISTQLFHPRGPFCKGDRYFFGTYEVTNSAYTNGEGFASKEIVANNTSTEYVLDLKNVLIGIENGTFVDVNQPLNVEISLAGNNYVNHRCKIVIRNSQGDYTLVDTTFGATQQLKFTKNIPFNKLENDSKIVYINVDNIPSDGINDRQVLHHYLFTQKRKPNLNTATGGTRIRYGFEASNGNKYFELTGLSSSGGGNILYDLSENKRYTTTNTSNLVKAYITDFSNDGSKLFVTSNTAITAITALSQVNFTNYSTNPGDFVIITHKSLTQGSTNYVEEYKNFRKTRFRNPVVVDVDQLFDQFAYGNSLHPIAMKNFSDYIYNTWRIDNTPPKYIFIIGRGLYYSQSMTNYSDRSWNLIPGFGSPPCDNLFSAPRGSSIPNIPIGRLACTSTVELSNYLEKIQQMENVQNNVNTTPNLLTWSKNVIHLNGGNPDEQIGIRNAQNINKTIIEGPKWGADVESFSGEALVDEPLTERFDSLVNNGTALITYIGHGNSSVIQFDLKYPDYYNNDGKNPVFMLQGCNVGDIYETNKDGISDRWVSAADKGAIACIASTDYGVSSDLFNYVGKFYSNATNSHYGEGIGDISKGICANFNNATGSIKHLISQNVIHGDPSFRINVLQKPDYEITQLSVKTIPLNLESTLNNFQINVKAVNKGRAEVQPDSLYLNIRLTNSNNSGNPQLILSKKIKSPNTADYNSSLAFEDTYNFSTSILKVGESNQLEIKIDGNNEKDEYDENNNVVTISRFISTNDIFPISPMNFGIVPTNTAELIASTGNTMDTIRNYIFEIDTTETFSSALKRTYSTNQRGGIVTWTPPITFMDSTVYYWRVKLNEPNNPNLLWKNRSFIYLNGEYPGWNQSHIDQWNYDTYNTMLLDQNDTIFKFVDNTFEISGNNKIMAPGYPGGIFTMYYNAALILNNACTDQNNRSNSGIAFCVINPETGETLKTVYDPNEPSSTTTHPNFMGTRKELLCYANPNSYSEVFYFPTEKDSINATWNDIYTRTQRRQFIIDFINNHIPDGYYVMMYTINMPRYEDIFNTNPALFSTISNLGGNRFSTLRDSVRPYALAFKKNDPSFTPIEFIGANRFDNIYPRLHFNTKWNEGNMHSTVIGPAAEWGSMHHRTSPLETLPNDDEQKVSIYGIDVNDNEILLFSNITQRDFYFVGSDTIRASQYPKIRLVYEAKDLTNRTPAQLNYWRVLFKEVPEAALAPNIHYSFNPNLNIGDNGMLSIAVKNISQSDMNRDSLQIGYYLQAGNNSTLQPISPLYPMQDFLNAGDTLISNIQFSTNGLSDGLNYLKIDVNELNHPRHQLEREHFNNVALIPFYVTGDRINPLLDVTFDGKHILNGDIVAPKPAIRVRLKDENLTRALTDSSKVRVRTFHNGVFTTMDRNNSNLFFTPADPNNLTDNSAYVDLTPNFTEDGAYELHILAKDQSNNTAEGTEYKISFNIIREESVSYVLNYPNPFTTSTRFVFTLTGTDVPDNFKIQIMTVSGKIVKEIMREELGNISIGRNISDYAWDGTDMFGDRLANGTYLYRVVVSNNGNKYKRYNGTDNFDQGLGKLSQFFKNDIGKMYLMR